MKVLLYFEKEEKIKKSGIGRALRHQIAALFPTELIQKTHMILHTSIHIFQKAKNLLKS